MRIRIKAISRNAVAGRPMVERLEGRQLLSAALPLAPPGVEQGQSQTIQLFAGKSFSGEVTAFSSAIGDGTFSAKIQWGDHTHSNAVVVRQSDGTYILNGGGA